MSHPQPSPPTSVLESIDRGVTSFLNDAQDTVRRQYVEIEDTVRRSPAASLATAVAVGYFLHRLPLRAIINAKLRVISAVAPPALFLFGAVKVYEMIKHEAEAARLRREYRFTSPPPPAPQYVD